MPRTITTAMIGALEASVIRPALLCELTFANETLYVWNGQGTLTWNSKTYSGIGEFGKPIDIIHRIAKSGIKFDQMIFENTWVHISFDPRMRNEIETAHFNKGQATYTPGA